MRRVWPVGMVVSAAVLASVAGVVLSAALTAVGGTRTPWLPVVQAHPVVWVWGAAGSGAVAALVTWWGQRVADRRRMEFVPAAQRPESWIVQRPVEVDRVVAMMRARRRATVGITTTVQGEGGFGKTTVAKLVCADRRVLRRFHGRVHWVTVGRDAREPGVLARKVDGLITQVDPSQGKSFTDVQQAGAYLAGLLAKGPRRLLVLDDVWFPEQVAAFPIAGRCQRVVTTRIPSLLEGECVPVRVDEVSPEQARAMLTSGLPPLPEWLVGLLLDTTGRWPLLLRLVNRVLVAQMRIERNTVAVARGVLMHLRSSVLAVDVLTGAAAQRLDINSPAERQRAVSATIEASAGLLAAVERTRFIELGVFAEDETVPAALIARLWAATAGMSTVETRALCIRLQDLALVQVHDRDEGTTVSVHDVVRDYLRGHLGINGLLVLNATLLDAIAIDLPNAAPLATQAGGDSRVTAWWALPESARYLWEHLVEHLLAADRRVAAEALVGDLRWVGGRLQFGVASPQVDLALVGTPSCVRQHRLLGQIAHLLMPTEPPHSRLDVLCSRVAHDPDWGPQALALTHARTLPRLTNRGPLPDLPHPALRRTLTGHQGEVTAVAISPDGTWVATTGKDGTVRLWDAMHGGQRTVLVQPGRGLDAVAISPDGTWLATLVRNIGHLGSVQIWDVGSEQRRATELDRRFSTGAVAISPDGTWLATGGVRGAPRLWDMVHGCERTSGVSLK